MPSREQILEINSEQEDLARIGISDASDVATVTIAGDDLAPAAPSSVSANAVPKGILVEWTNPTLNEDGSTCTDQRWAKLYYKSTTGVTKSVYDGTYVVGAKQGTNSAFTDPNVGTGTARYYVVTAMDVAGNESTASAEVNSTGGGAGETTSIPDDCSGLVFDDTKGTEGIIVGDGILGIAFKQPASTWSNFDHYRLWYSVDSNGGFGAWTEITPTNRIGYLHKGLTKTYDYRYKGTIVAADGTESSTADKAKADDSGYTPNGSANNLLIAELIFAENLICVNEVRGEHFYAQSYLAINDTTFGNDGIQLEYNSGNPRGYIGNGVTGSSGRFFNFDGTNISWGGANTSLTAAGAFVASSATISGAITATSGTIGSFTIGTYLYTGSKTAYNDANAGVHLGSDGLGIGDNVFTVSSAGALVATSATITGTITSSAVTITGGTLNINSGVFSVSAAGAVTMTSATITGSSYIGTVSGLASTSIAGWAHGSDTTKIDGGDIYTNSVTATQINVTNLAAINADMGTITAGSMSAARITSGSFTAARVLISGATTLENWRHASDLTKIDGGDIYTNSVTATQINVTNLAAINADMGTITAGSMDAARITAGSLVVARTDAKCTDANADQTSANTAADTSAVNGLASSSVSGWAHGSDTTKINGGDIYTNTVTATQINVTNLAAINADLGSITAGTITGGTIQTAASGNRVVMSATNADRILFYDATRYRVYIYYDGIRGYDSSGTQRFALLGSVGQLTLATSGVNPIIISGDGVSNTGGAQGTAAGRITITADGVTRYIRLYT